MHYAWLAGKNGKLPKSAAKNSLHFQYVAKMHRIPMKANHNKSKESKHKY